MPIKQVPISARISQEDATFINRLSIEDAKTPSDKLRAIIAEARRQRERKPDYAGSLQMMQEIVLPVLQAIREKEVENGIHSELITRLAEWIPDVVAFLVSSINEKTERETKEAMLQLEQGAAERLFRLMESILQLAVTGHCACYDPDAINRKIGPVLELSQIIMARK